MPGTADGVPVNGHDEGCVAARRALFAFLLTFVASRAMVLLIMSGRVPNLYFFLRGTHVHHLNYGIFLLAGVGAYLVVRRPAGRAARIAALVYGVALGLTFDEFGMWLHLGGSYWQRASFDAIVVLAAALGLAGFAPPMRPWRPKLLVAVLLIFGLLIIGSFRLAARAEPRLQRWEQRVRS